MKLGGTCLRTACLTQLQNSSLEEIRSLAIISAPLSGYEAFFHVFQVHCIRGSEPR